MDWIDSQQWFLQIENESLHHFLSFSLFSSFLPSLPLPPQLLFPLPLSLLKDLRFFSHTPPIPPSSALSRSLLLLCHHHNIWLTYVWAFTPCQLAGICTHAHPHKHIHTISCAMSHAQEGRRQKKGTKISLNLLLTEFTSLCVCVPTTVPMEDKAS